MKHMKKYILSVLAVCIAAAMIFAGCSLTGQDNTVETQVQTEPPTERQTEAPTAPSETAPESYLIEDVEVIPQKDLKAGCETYACTMLLRILGFNLTEYDFADNYVEVQWPYYDAEGNMYAADMNSASVGSPYSGWGVYAPAMARFMNHYLSDQKSKLHAYNYENIPLQELCEKYVCKDIPVMIWATTAMMEPFIKDTWTVNYVDENAKTKIGDQFSWWEHEHCLVLIGYDEEYYYFADSFSETVSVFEKEICQTRYEQMFSQCIVVQ